ncbi:MAG: LLM class flavin-dependent oxidoreductase, partial [Sphaerobacteraceae bacterium]
MTEFTALRTGLSFPASDVSALSPNSADLDLVSLDQTTEQNHNADPWTLANWLAATTTGVEIMIPIPSDQLQYPAVLARAAISSDLLSGGRVALNMGSGTESADQLAAAIQILREMMNVANRRPLETSGSFYRVEGAQRGPIPTRDIPIWITGATPELLQLTGQLADGWTTPYPDMPARDLIIASEFIDAVAIESDRDPEEIQRSMIISEKQLDGSIDDLTDALIRARIGTILLQSADEHQIDTFLNQIAPELRSRLESADPDRSSTRRVRRAEVRKKRIPGIDYDGVPESLKNAVIEPGDVAYPRVRSTYIRGGAPGIV